MYNMGTLCWGACGLEDSAQTQLKVCCIWSLCISRVCYHKVMATYVIILIF